MTQRKLTQEELQHVEKASWYLQYVIKQCGLIRGGGVVLVDYLNEIAAHGTTDGKPWIEPQPEIGEGYRAATLSDAHRRDRQVWCDGFWLNAPIGHTETNRVYSVAKDRIPTDEDAKGRPTVMVRDNDKQDWQARKLLAVTGCLDKFVTSSSSGVARFWMQARFPYPGELG